MSGGFSTEDYMPDWSTARFAVLDPSARWGPAIHREVIDRLSSRADSSTVHSSGVAFEACSTARDAMLVCELSHTVGLVMFASGVERDVLSLLGGLARRHRFLPTLVVAERIHEELLPVLYEAGAHTVMFDVKDDIPIA